MSKGCSAVAAGTAPAAAALSVRLRRLPLHTPKDEPAGQDLEVTGLASAAPAGHPADHPAGHPADPADQPADPIGALTRGLTTLLVEYPVTELAGEGLAVVALTPQVVTGGLPVPFDPGAAVIRTGVGAQGHPAELAALTALADAGHPLALDGITGSAAARPALSLVRYAVVDVPADPDDRLRWDDVAAIASAAQQYGVTLIARGAGTPAARARCADLGADLLLGPLPAPEHGTGRVPQPRQASALRLLGELSDPLAEVAQIADVIKTDPALSFELLRVANSAAMGYPRTISELRDAVMIVGLARLRAWVALVALSPAGPLPDALTTAVIQARTCELLAGRLHQGPPGVAFVVGLLDGVAAALGLEPGALVDALPKLSREVVDAITGVDQALHAVLVAARGVRDAGARATTAGFEHSAVTHAYLDALVWSAQTARAVADRGATGDRG